MMKKPTIEELQKILDDPEEHPIQIQPDGSISVDRRKKGSGFEILTKQQNLGSTY